MDHGAERALRERGTSLLPVGVVEVSGAFSAGDAVEVLAAEDGGRPIGKGIVNYSAEELRQVKGSKTEEVARCCRAHGGGGAQGLLRAGVGARYPLPMAVATSVAEICAAAKRASRELARLDTRTRNAALGGHGRRPRGAG